MDESGRIFSSREMFVDKARYRYQGLHHLVSLLPKPDGLIDVSVR